MAFLLPYDCFAILVYPIEYQPLMQNPLPRFTHRSKKSETLLVEIRCETSRAAGIRIHSRIIDWMRDSTGPHFVGCDAEEVDERGGADRDRHMPGRIVFSISEVVFLVLRDVVWHG